MNGAIGLCTCAVIGPDFVGERLTIRNVLCPIHGDIRDTNVDPARIPFSLKDGTTEGMERLIAAIREEPEVDG